MIPNITVIGICEIWIVLCFLIFYSKYVLFCYQVKTIWMFFKTENNDLNIFP